MRILAFAIALATVALPAYAQKAPGAAGKYAVVDAGNNVVNMVDWDGATDYLMPCDPCTFVAFGALQPAQVSQWAARAPVPAAKPRPTPREWLERLSDAKQAAIAAAGAGNGTILLWLLKAAGSPDIDVTSPETIAGVAALVQAGVLTADDQALLLAP